MTVQRKILAGKILQIRQNFPCQMSSNYSLEYHFTGAFVNIFLVNISKRGDFSKFSPARILRCTV